eukprot:6172089-Pleurochrysis_carterae.AAC.1
MGGYTVENVIKHISFACCAGTADSGHLKMVQPVSRAITGTPFYIGITNSAVYEAVQSLLFAWSPSIGVKHVINIKTVLITSCTLLRRAQATRTIYAY